MARGRGGDRGGARRGGETLRGLRLLRWAHGGDAVAVPDEGPLAGRIVFVPRGVPGDVVTARVERVAKRWARARLETIVVPSPHRRDPPCAVQARCGGCPWMAGDAGAQAASRAAIVRGEAAKRLGWDEATLDARVAAAPAHGPELGYRARARLAWRATEGGAVTLGYRSGGTHELVDAPDCGVLTPQLREALRPLRDELSERARGQRGEARVLAGVEGTAIVVAPAEGPSWRLGPAEVSVPHGPYDVTAAPERFVQANPTVAGAIGAHLEAAARAMGRPGHAVELFAGIGTLTVPLLRAGWRVTAYELDAAVRPLFEANTTAEGEATLHVADLLAVGTPEPAPEAARLVVLDPPREGASELMPWVRGCRAEHVLMVACDVATAMRDLAALSAGPWEVRRVTAYDMFPQTGHQELVCELRRRPEP